ncbi:MAG TPA: tripartite tricarboxylate transporter substrate binding protein [Burkholderiaceae bacterium]|nr:tripartite tricarboxylate transporter substrate binding protein [Burkholderiaceae bacterium]
MKKLISISVAVLALAFAAGPPQAHAQAEKFPAKPIRVIVPYGPGGGTDNLMRLLAPVVSNSIGQPLVIENRPGAATVIGSDLVAKAPADGYTLLATDTAVVVNPGLLKKMPFDTLKDLTGVTMMATAPVLLVTHPSVPAKDLKELLALAKQKPGQLNYASGGNGTSTHLAAELMKLAAGVDITHIPYKGTGPAMNDLLGGQVHMQFAGISTARQFVEAGRLRAMAVTGSRRNPAMPDVPTFAEMGVPGVDADSWWGVYAPAGTPPEVLSMLSEHLVKALRAPELQERLAALGFIPVGNSPQEHTQQMRKMVAQWADVIKRANIQAD